MRTSYLTYGAVALLTGIAAASGCSDNTDTETGDGGTGGTGGSQVVGPGPTTTTTGAGGSTMGDGNDSFDEAQDISLDMDQFGTLEPADTDEDYYKFTAQAGDLLFIDSAAKPETDAFSDAYPDLVITLYDSNQNKVAENDDPYLVRDTNDSQVWYLAPTTGDYYIRVTDCLSVFGTESCAGPETIVNHDYGVRVSVIDPADDGVVLDSEPSDATGDANAMEWVEDGAGSGDYFASINYGTFSSESDVDVYSYVVPSGINLDAALLFGAIFIQGPEGPDGMGTTNNIGNAWITEANGTTVISRIDHSQQAADARDSMDLRAPMTAGSQYWLFVEHPGGSAGANDFYIFNSNATETNPLEGEDPTMDNGNSTPATAEALATMANGELTSAFVGGTLIVDNAVDHFEVTVPGSFTGTLSVACGARRSGSGVRGLTIDVLKGSDDSSIMASSAETESEDLVLDDVNVGTESTVIVKVSAGTNDATVSSRFYQCGIHFVPPAP